MKLTRRRFLDLGMKSTLLLSAARWPSLRAESTVGSPSFFVHVRTLGGMDCTLGLDPLRHSTFHTNNDQIFLEYRPDEILSGGSFELGPAGLNLLPFAGQFSLIRGIHMRMDIQHEPMNEFWARASLASSSSAIVFSVAERLGLGSAVSANLPNFSSVRPRRLPSRYGTAGSVLQPLSDLEWLALEIANPQVNWAKARAEDEAYQKVLQNISAALCRLPQDTDEMIWQATALSILMREGLTHLAVLDLNRDVGGGGSLDTHSDHEKNHLRVQTDAWSKVAELFKLFQGVELEDGRSLFDATTFLVTSEFSRTPFLNFSKGKDHNVNTNAALVVGPRIRKATAVGASRVITHKNRLLTKHVGAPFDFTKSRVLSSSEMKLVDPRALDFEKSTTSIRQIFPEDVVATVLEAAFGDAVDEMVLGRKIRALLV